MTTRDVELGPAAVAIADLVRRTGATHFELGWLRDEDEPEYGMLGPGWYCAARYRGSRITAEDHAHPADACDALAGMLLDADSGGCSLAAGARCSTCGRSTYVPVRGGPCVWHREGDRWFAGCAAGPPRGGNRAQRRKGRQP